ncbi:MAG TPA: hypothetical protein VK798_14615 [Alloacidobacterium sp.]|jgi:hypothetical protein|nr:hypothetical protein [Alloacidobacterium sp.]
MQRKTSIAAVFLFSGFLLYQGFAPSLQAQMASIALFPDSLLAQSANPQAVFSSVYDSTVVFLGWGRICPI